jgi:hypothetical protein
MHQGRLHFVLVEISVGRYHQLAGAIYLIVEGENSGAVVNLIGNFF